MGEIGRVPYSDINRGSFYLAAIPFSDGLPLDFLQPCNKCDNSTDMCGIVQTSTDCFNPDHDPQTGRDIIKDVRVIVPHKARYCLVIQNNVLNHDNRYHHVYVIPVTKIYDDEMDKPLIKRIMTKNDLPQFHYIGKHTGQHAYLKISDIKRIDKSLLLQPFLVKAMSNEELTIVCRKAAALLDIKEIQQCDECKRNCDNCELRKNAIIVNI